MSAEWPEVELADLATEITVGFVGSMTHEYVESGVPFFRSKNIEPYEIDWNDIRYISEEFHRKISKSTLRAGDVAIVRTGKPGTTCVIPESVDEANCSDLVIVRVDDQKLSAYYLSYFMNSVASHQVSSRLVGAVQQHFNVGSAKKILIPLPSREEQERIVNILKSLDDKIELNRQINQTLEQIAQTIFKSWFVDFEPVKAKIEAKAAGRDPERAAMCAISGKLEPELDQLPPEQYQQLAATAALFPDALVESALGLIPEGWTVSEIGKEVTVVGGGTPSTKIPEFWNGEFAWVTPKDLSGLSEKTLVRSERKITAAGVGKISSGQLPTGTVLLSSRAPIGYLVLSMIPVSINQGFIAMLCNNRLPNTYVLQWATASLDAIKQRGSGTTFSEISKSNFRPMQVLVPDGDTLDMFQRYVFPLYEKITAFVCENETLATLRDTLLPKLLSGELSVGRQEVASAMETAG